MQMLEDVKRDLVLANRVSTRGKTPFPPLKGVARR
jgi:hypothetical protein